MNRTSKSDVLRAYIEMENDGTQTSIEQLSGTYGVPYKELVEFFRYPPIVKALAEQYNLPPPPKQLSKRALTDEQRRWLRVCTNPHTRSNLTTMANDFGISIQTHDRWMQQAHFSREYTKLIQKRVGSMKGEIIRRTAQRSADGDLKAVELIYRMTGTPIPAAITEQDSTKIDLDIVVRALQKHLDQDTLAAVAGEMLKPTLAIEQGSEPDDDD